MNLLFQNVIADELKLCGFNKEVADAQTSLMGRVFWGFSKERGIVKGILIGLDHNHYEENIMQIYADKPTVVECAVIAPTKEILEELIERLKLKAEPEKFTNSLTYFDFIKRLVRGKVAPTYNKQVAMEIFERMLKEEYKPTVILMAGLNDSNKIEFHLFHDKDSSLSIETMKYRLKQYDSL